MAVVNEQRSQQTEDGNFVVVIEADDFDSLTDPTIMHIVISYATKRWNIHKPAIAQSTTPFAVSKKTDEALTLPDRDVRCFRREFIITSGI